MQLWPSSAFALIAGNAVPALGVLFFDWPLFPIVLVYWCEMVVIFVITLLRMAFGPGALVVKALLLPFLPLVVMPQLFAVLFFGLTWFLFAGNKAAGEAFFSIVFAASDAKDLLSWDEIGRVLQREIDMGMRFAIAAIAASHVYSFVVNYLLRGERNRVTFLALWIWPFARAWLSMLAVMAGILAVAWGGVQPPALLVLVICAKTALDLYGHLREHRAAAA
jgi:hypothetical protein